MTKLKNQQYPALMILEKLVAQKNPNIAKIIATYGDKTIGQYITELTSYKTKETINPSSDVFEAIETRTKQLYGDKIARYVQNRLQKYPVINTGNHAGIQTDPPTFHWLLFSAFGEKPIQMGNSPLPTIIVLSCGNVPLDNPTKPMGIIVGSLRINIFSNKYAHIMTHVAPAFTRRMIAEARASLKSKTNETGRKITISGRYIKAVNIILDACQSPEILSQKSYINQAALVNSKIWRKIFSNDDINPIPELIFLEQESVTKDLLVKDLKDPNSLVYQILFNDQLRAEVILALDGVRGCWNNEQLQLLSTNSNLDLEKRKQMTKSSMTHFFWGIDEKLESYPLALIREKGGFVLRRVDKIGVTRDVEFTPKSLLSLIENGSAVPALVITFASIHFARGIMCLGGFNQIDYLARMGDGFKNALLKIGNKSWAGRIKTIDNMAYLLNLPLLLADNKNSLRHAGPLEIITKGGLTKEEVKRVKLTPLKILHQISLPGIAPIISNTVVDQKILDQAREEVLKLGKKYFIWI